MKKNKYDKLDDDWKDTVANSNNEEILKKIAEIAIEYENIMAAKENDEDLALKKEEAKVAGEVYSEATKIARLRIQYARQILEDRGLELATPDPK